MATKKYKFRVKVPKTPRSAYNPDRPITGLIENQVHQVAALEAKLPVGYRSRVDVASIKTERQAGEYLQAVTARLHRTAADAEAPSVQKVTQPRRQAKRPAAKRPIAVRRPKASRPRRRR